MDITQELVQQIDLLYKIALSKTGDTHDADDLVQETYLSTLKVINKGIKIDNIKAYLIRVLNNKYQALKNKNNSNIVIYCSELYEHTIQSEYIETEGGLTYEENHDNSQECKAEIIEKIRRELAFLSKMYRDVMVQYYIESKSINEIASNLKISRSSVLSRLDRGRKKIKKGVIEMKTLTEKSFNPDLLSIVTGGLSGANNEPISVVNNKIEQNLLILAYEKPITIKEISEKIGVATVFVEEAVDKLLKNELMKKINNRIYTNFLILDNHHINKMKIVQKQFVDETYDEVIIILKETIDEYKNTGVLHLYNDTQMYIFALLSIFYHVHFYLIETLDLIKFEDYPDRPNGGKWIIHYGYKVSENEESIWKPTIFVSENITTTNLEKIFIEMWDISDISSISIDDNLFNLNNIVQLLYSLHKEEEIPLNKMRLIPELIEYGLIKNSDNNKKEVSIPIISESDYQELVNINFKYAKKMIDVIGDRLIKMIKNNAIVCPKQITPVPPSTYLLCKDGISLQYAFRVAEEGLIQIEKNKKYPVCMIVEG